MASTPVLPNFLVIGAGRSGTTSLHHYLAQHPDVFVSPHKAPSYFYCAGASVSTDRQRRLTTRAYFTPDRADYLKLFAPSGSASAVGEVSPAYLASTGVAARIASHNPDMRLIAVVRNPVDRVRARYLARRRDGLEPAPDLAAAVACELNSALDLDDTTGTYLAAGFTSHILATYQQHFAPEQLSVRVFEDLSADPAGLMAGLFAFLGVDPSVSIDTTRVHNRSGGEIANPLVRALWVRSATVRTAVRPWVPTVVRDAGFSLATRRVQPVPDDTAIRDELTDYYRDEVAALSLVIGRDLSHWSRSDRDRDRDGDRGRGRDVGE